MCVIVHCEKAIPTLADLLKMQSSNSAGGGIAWFEKDAVHWAKGINAHRIFNIASTVKLPVVIHFRLATVGGVVKGLCHPFPLTEKAELWKKGMAEGVLFHNGHEHNWETLYLASGLPKLNGPVSDTRALAAITGRNRTPSWLNKLTGKFIAMFESKTGPVVERMGFFTEKDGMHFSNTHWDTAAVTTWGNGTFRGQQWHGNDEYWDRDRDYTGHRPSAPVPAGAHLNGVTYGNDGELVNGTRHSKRCTCRACVDIFLGNRKRGNGRQQPQQYPGHVGYNHTKQCRCWVCIEKRNEAAIKQACTRADSVTDCKVTVETAKGPGDGWIQLGAVWEKELFPAKDHFPFCNCTTCIDYRNQQFRIKQDADLNAQVEARDRELALQDERDLQQAVTDGMSTHIPNPAVKQIVDKICKEAVSATVIRKSTGNNGAESDTKLAGDIKPVLAGNQQ